MSEERDAEIARLKEALDELRKRLERSTSTLFEPGDELVWFDQGEVNTMGAHTHISGPRNYFIHQADGRGSDQLFTVKRYDEETSTTIIIGRNLPDWETATAVAQADFARCRSRGHGHHPRALQQGVAGDAHETRTRVRQER